MTTEQMIQAVQKTALAAEMIEQRQRIAQVREDSWQTIARLFKRPNPVKKKWYNRGEACPASPEEQR